MAVFLIAEITGGVLIYQQQNELQNDVHNAIRVSVERHYGNDVTNNFKLDVIQEGVKWQLSFKYNQIFFNRFLFNVFLVEMLRNDRIQELVPLWIRETTDVSWFHRRRRYLHGPEILLYRPIV